MLPANTTLVLGAGSSIALGYPTGEALRRELLRLVDTDLLGLSIEAQLRAPDQASLQEFVDGFRQSQMYSIDAFLARRPEFTEIGKRAIAALLLRCEQNSSLDRWQHEDGWLQYLWNRFASASWEELDFSRLRIVTFNYDRSLEHYLLQAISHSHGKALEDALEKLSGLQIVHVYGSLGGALPGHPNYLDYGIGHRAAPQAALSLQVIPEGRDDSAVLNTAREHLLWADRIGFLGFGFDETNMRRLDTTVTCERFIQRADGQSHRPVHATGLGMTKAEREEAMRRLGTTSPVSPKFHYSNCLTMLRESALLR